MTYLYDGLWAIDPSDPANVAVESQVTIFDPSDSSHLPIQLTDPDGLPVANPLVTNEKGFVGAFRSDLKRVGWAAAGLSGYIASFDGISEELETTLIAATGAATDAEAARAAAERAANMVGIPADETVAGLLGTDGSDTQSAADARYSKRGEVFVSVRDYGATGSGLDETAMVQAALDAVDAAGGGEVILPMTVMNTPYRLGKLFAGRDTTLRCMPGVVIKRKGMTFGVINRPQDGSNPLADNTDPYSGHGNLKIIGGIWDGALLEEAYARSGFNVFHFILARDIYMEDVEVRDVVTNHAVDINGILNLRFKNCKFLGYKDATIVGDATYPRDYTEALQYGPFSEDPSGFGDWVKYGNGAASRTVVLDNVETGASGTLGTQAWPTGFGNHSAIAESRGQLTGGIKMRDCVFADAAKAGVTLYTYNDVDIDNCDFLRCQTGIMSTVYTNSKRWNTSTSAWEVAPPRQNCFNQKIRNCLFEDTKGADIVMLGVKADATNYATIGGVGLDNNKRRINSKTRTSAQVARLFLCDDVTITRHEGEYSTSGLAIEACRRVKLATLKIKETLGYGVIVTNVGEPAAGWTTDVSVTDVDVENAGSHGIGLIGIKGFRTIGNAVRNNGRLSNGVGLILTNSTGGLVSANTVECTSLPFQVVGIQGSGLTNTNVTLDNRIAGVTTAIASLNGAGVVYGNIQYT